MLPGDIPQEAVMVEVQHVQPEGLTDNRNRYSHIVKIGPWVFIAGQGPGDGHGGMPSDPVAQVDNVYRNLATAVESVGGSSRISSRPRPTLWAESTSTQSRRRVAGASATSRRQAPS